MLLEKRNRNIIKIAAWQHNKIKESIKYKTIKRVYKQKINFIILWNILMGWH